MKEQLDESEKECARLRQENENLKGRIAELEREVNLCKFLQLKILAF